MHPNILYVLQLNRSVKTLHYKKYLRMSDIVENHFLPHSNGNCETLGKDQNWYLKLL